MHSVYSLQLSFFSSVHITYRPALPSLPLYIITTILFSLQYGQTPVYCASRRGHVPVVELLMKIGADIRICDKVYDFPLNYGLSIVAVSVDSIAINMFHQMLHKLTYSRTTDW